MSHSSNSNIDTSPPPNGPNGQGEPPTTPRAPTRAKAKEQAKRLRADLARQGDDITHGQALETVAHQNGFRDWNAFHAALEDGAPENWTPGGRVAGHYLSQPFQATVITSKQERPGWFRLALELDEAVDVVVFESFSNFRKRIHVVVGPDGYTFERTSDGTPHAVLKM